MTKYFRLLYIGFVLLLSGCSCKNLAGGQGESRIPKFSLSLEESLQGKNLFTNKPVDLVLKENNLSKNKKFVSYKIVELEQQGGILISADSTKKSLKIGDELIIEGGSMPLLFSPSGKAGKGLVSMVLEHGGESSAAFKLDFNLQGPAFSLSLKEELQRKPLYTYKPIDVVLKGKDLSKNESILKCKIVELDQQGGILIFADGTKKELHIGDELIIENGVIHLNFSPSGKAGKGLVSIVLEYKGEKTEDLKLDLDLKAPGKVSLSTPQNIETGKIATLDLKLFSVDPEEEFTIQSITPFNNNAEIAYDSGAEPGVWSEISPVRIGDKLKSGEYELNYKLLGYYDKNENSREVFKGKKDSNWFEKNIDSGVNIVLTDKNGNEYEANGKYKIHDFSYKIELKDIAWTRYSLAYPETYKRQYGEGMIQFKIDISEAADLTDLIKKFGHNRFKVLSFRSNDNTPVSLFNYSGKPIIGTLMDMSIDETLCFRLDEMYLLPENPPTILTLKVVGPTGIIKTIDIEVAAAHKEIIVGNVVEYLTAQAKHLCKDYMWIMDYSNEYKKEVEAKKIGERASVFIKKVTGFCSQIESVAVLKHSLSPRTLKDLEHCLNFVSLVKGHIEKYNKKYGFNF